MGLFWNGTDRGRGLVLGLALCMALTPKLGHAQPTAALREIQDLRVYLDFDEDSTTFASWPIDKFGQKLPADQIARGARLGLSLWASVLPDMHFHFVSAAKDANLIMRFGPYSQAPSMGMSGWARAFLPDEWALKPESSCGKFRESQWPDGSPCQEWSQNIITFNTICWAVSGADFASNWKHHEYLAWVYDPANRHFRKTPDGPCVDGLSAGVEWSDVCVPFTASPHHLEIQGVDLVSVIVHEFGHTLVGGHTPEPPGDVYIDWHRRPILNRSRCVRLGPNGFSILFPGYEDKWWNRRCAFPADILRLRNQGYRVNYPKVPWTLIMRRPDGKEFRTQDWSVVQAKMIWTRQRTPLSPTQAARQYFLVALESNAPTNP